MQLNKKLNLIFVLILVLVLVSVQTYQGLKLQRLIENNIKKPEIITLPINNIYYASPISNLKVITKAENKLFNNTTKLSGNLDIPESFRWHKVDYSIIREHLKQRNSELLNGNYLEDLELVAKKYDLDPLLLLSIMGAEQSFVPESAMSNQIMKNPFNLFGSWKNYGESFKKSLNITSRTIINLMKGYGDVGGDPYSYLNKRYAEDPNWKKNVNSIHHELLALIQK